MEDKISAIIIDDEQEARDILENLLSKFPEIEIIDKLPNVDAGVNSFIKNKPDIVFLDVQMPQKNGFEFIHEINRFNINSTIIFTTAYNEYAIEALRHSAFDFLLKPINQGELQNTILRYKAKTEKDNLKDNIEKLIGNLTGVNKLKLNTRTGFQFINPENIVYLEADGNYTNIHCSSGKKIISTMNLGKVEELLNSNSFFRISRSALINSSYLTSIDRKTRLCCLEADQSTVSLPISKSYIKSLADKL